MAKDPAFLFYSSDFITGVSFLTMEERGQYITALCLLHQHGGYLSKESLEVAVGKIGKKLSEKFGVDENGRLYNKRLLEETIKRNAFCESRRKNINHRYTRSTYVKHKKLHMENEDENENRDVNINRKKKYIDKILLQYPYLKDTSFCNIFESYLKTRKTKATDHAKTLILKDLHRVDMAAAIAMLEQSIKNGWVGVFPVRDNNSLKARPTQAQINTMASMALLRERWEEEDAEKNV